MLASGYNRFFFSFFLFFFLIRRVFVYNGIVICTCFCCSACIFAVAWQLQLCQDPLAGVVCN